MTGLLAALKASPFALRLAKWGALALMAASFALALRKSGEKAGRLVQKIEMMEVTNDVQRAMLDAGADRPRGRSDLAERMRDGRF